MDVPTNATLEKLFEAPMDALLVVDALGNVRMMNSNTETMFGYKRDELLGQNMDILLPERFRARHETHHERYYADPHARPMGIGLELLALHADGREFPVEISLTPLQTDGDTLIAAAVRDMTLLHRSEAQAARLGRVLEHSLNEIYLFSEDSLHFTLVNKGARDNLGYDLDELKIMTPPDIKPDFTQASFTELLEPLKSGAEAIIQFTTRHARKDGTTYPVEVHLQRFEDERLFAAVILDISERLATQEALRESETRMVDHLSRTPLAVIEWDVQDQTITSWNPSAERIFGYKASEVVGKETVEVIVPAKAQPQLTDIWQGRIDPGGVRNTNANVHKDGNLLHCEWFNTPLKNETGKVVRMAALALDVTSRQRAQEALFTAQEEERARISRDLHDEVGQSLTAILLNINSLADTADALKLERLRSLTSQALEDVRRLSRDLRPALLDELGLKAAVERLGRDLEQQTHSSVDVLVNLPAHVSKVIEIVAYRVAQEALTNIARHAHAEHVSVVVTANASSLRLIIEDDGHGFDTESVVSSEHVGVAGMRERVELLGGNLRLESAPGRGAIVSASLPL